MIWTNRKSRIVTIDRIRAKRATVKIAISNGLFNSALNATANTLMHVWEIKPRLGSNAKTISALALLGSIRTDIPSVDVAKIMNKTAFYFQISNRRCAQKINATMTFIRRIDCSVMFVMADEIAILCQQILPNRQPCPNVN